jgi:hypothetical protein
MQNTTTTTEEQDEKQFQQYVAKQQFLHKLTQETHLLEAQFKEAYNELETMEEQHANMMQLLQKKLRNLMNSHLHTQCEVDRKRQRLVDDYDDSVKVRFQILQQQQQQQTHSVQAAESTNVSE